MIELRAPYRVGVPGDGVALARLVNMAGEGLPLYLWSGMAEGGESPWDVGAARARRESGAFSYRNAIVREEAGEVIACLIGYPLEANAAPADYSGLPPMFVPLQELEDLAPGTWYVNVLAVDPGYRGGGIGRELLSLADDIARGRGDPGLSIIVADANAGARRLYERMGYVERARRPMVKEGRESRGREWVLLVKEL